MSHKFGGDWTLEKLERVRKYLSAYTTLMKGNPRSRHFRIAYIDAFAGTGYRTVKSEDNPNQLLMPELAEDEPQGFLDGSATIALKIEPRFDSYIFIEKDKKRFSELQKLKEDFPDFKENIRLVQSDANSYIMDLCKKDWSKNRAVLFLDPYGMQVEWQTVVAVANTQAIDLWYLFPLGMGLHRLLAKDGKISLALQQRLNRLLGQPDWFNYFYQDDVTLSMFGEETNTRKIANTDFLERYFVSRLRTVFPAVADNPLILRNSNNSPMYLLCFASSNPKGGPTAIRIAQDILKK